MERPEFPARIAQRHVAAPTPGGSWDDAAELIVELGLHTGHRHHDLGEAHLAGLPQLDGSLEDGADLHLVDLGHRDTQTHAAQAQHGVVFAQCLDAAGHGGQRQVQRLGRQWRQETIEILFEIGGEQALAIAEERVDRTLGHARLPGDQVHRQCLLASVGKDRVHCVEDQPAPGFGVDGNRTATARGACAAARRAGQGCVVARIGRSGFHERDLVIFSVYPAVMTQA